jgi:hypothetical protein
MLVTPQLSSRVGGVERSWLSAYLQLEKDFDVGPPDPQGCRQYASPASRASICPLSPSAGYLACVQWRAYRLARGTRVKPEIAGSSPPSSRMWWWKRTLRASCQGVQLGCLFRARLGLFGSAG